MSGPLLEAVLDRTVVAGYTNLGYKIRARGWHESERQHMFGKVVLISGASSGLGFAAAEGFARLGASIWLLARTAEGGEKARANIIERTGNGNVHVALCDLSRLDSVRRAAERFQHDLSRLDVLVNNAGVMTNQRERSTDGIELTLATNVVGPFLLTSLLIPMLIDSTPSRIVNVSSGGMYTQRLRIDNLQGERGEFDGPTMYAQTKRAQVILTELCAKRLAGTGIVVHAMHPGWADTPGLKRSLPRFHQVTRPLLRTPPQGADTIVWLGAAAEPARSSGRFWHDRRPRPTHLLKRTRESEADRERLWMECVQLSGCPEWCSIN